MEGSAKIDLDENCGPLSLELGSKPTETIPYRTDGIISGKGPDSGHYPSGKSVEANDGALASLNTFSENDKKQVMPVTISVSSGVAESKVAAGPKGLAPVQLVSVRAGKPENHLPHSRDATLERCSVEAAVGVGPFSINAVPPKDSLCLQDIRSLQQVTSAVAHSGQLPLQISSASNRSGVSQLATSAPAVPVLIATSETEHRRLDSDEGIAFRRGKFKKRPRQLQQDGRTCDSNKSGKKQPVIRWKDVWVAQLIHIRGRMHSTFTGPQRQRVDLWQIVKHEMTNSCHGFDKDSEACRKKWIRVYKEYKDDRRLSNDEKLQKCKFYDLVDFYMGDRASSFRNIHVCPEISPLHPDVMHTATDSMVIPLLLSEQLDIKAVDGGPMVPQVRSDTSLSKPTTDTVSKKFPPAKKSRVIETLVSPEQPPQPPFVLEAPVVIAATTKKPPIKSSVHTMLSELVNIGKEMLQMTRDFEKEKLTVLHSIKDTLGKIARKI